MSAYDVRRLANERVQDKINEEVNFLVEQAGANSTTDRHRVGRISAFREAQAIIDGAYRDVSGG